MHITNITKVFLGLILFVLFPLRGNKKFDPRYDGIIDTDPEKKLAN